MSHTDSLHSETPPDASFLIDALGLEYAITGFYDLPSTDGVPGVIEKRGCLFSCFGEWQKGKMTRISRMRPGCPGSAYWLCGNEAMPHDDFLDFLVTTEGIKPDHERMQLFLDSHRPYAMKHRYLLFGPLLASIFQYCRTVTLFCNPDQLSALIVGINSLHQTGAPYPVVPSIGPGCYQVAGVFPCFDDDYAVISSTDIAMRRYLPEHIMSLTVTRSLYWKLCAFDANAFLGKSFWKGLVAKREKVHPHPGS